MADLTLPDCRRLLVPARLLQLTPDGHYTPPAGQADLVWPNVTSAPPVSEEAATLTIPLIAERLDIRKQAVATGKARVTKLVQTHEEPVDLPTLREEFDVERVPVGRFVSQDPPVRREGGRRSFSWSTRCSSSRCG